MYWIVVIPVAIMISIPFIGFLWATVDGIVQYFRHDEQYFD